MKAVFADTFFYIALLDESDACHALVRTWFVANARLVVTTRWVLAETADALCATRTRQGAARLLDRAENDPNTTITSASDDLYHRGRKLYAQRGDKDWSLTGDRHFSQAGFTPLFAKA